MLFLLASCNFSPSPQNPNTGNVTRTSALQVGLLGEYFPNAGFSGEKLNQIDPKVSFEWGSAAPLIGLRPGNFSARWSGYLQAKYSEETTFYFETKGEAKLWLDGQAVASGGKVQLEANRRYALRLEFQKTSDDAALELLWESLSQPKAVIEPLQFYTPNFQDISLQTAAPGQAPRGQNFLVNPGFESGVGSWSLAAGGTYALATPGQSGSGSAARLTNWAWVQQNLPSNFVEGGATLNIESWGRSLNGTACVIGVSGQTLASVAYEKTISFSASTWARQSTTFLLPGDAAWASVSMRGNAGECQFDDLSISIGTALAPQTPQSNVLLNSGFESDQTNWTRSAGTSSIVAGRASAKALSASSFAWVQQNVAVGSVLQGQNYILTGWAKAAAGATCSIGISGNTTTNNSFAQTLSFTNTAWEQKSLMQFIPTNLSWVAVYATSTSPACQFDDLALGQNLGGLSATYFDNIDLTGTQRTRTDASINFNWAAAAPITGIAPTTYSVRWTGQIAAPTTGSYTFYLTHTDGARLMVNGQVLVNNWRDQASLTDSASITLQANVRYDVRLEYYRNSTNPGQIRMEWQSNYLSRQDVFSDRLFSSGSNAISAINIIKNNPSFVNIGNALDTTTAVGNLTRGKFSMVAREGSTENYVSVIVDLSQSAITQLLRYEYNTPNVTIRNLLNSNFVQLSNIGQYANTDGSMSPAQTEALAKRLTYLFLDEVSSTSLWATTGLSSQGFTGVCNECEQQALALRAALTTFAGLEGIRLALFPDYLKSPKRFWDAVLVLFNQNIQNGISPDDRLFKQLIDDFINCQIRVCPPLIRGLSANPNPILIPKNTSRTTTISFANIPSSRLEMEYTVLLTNTSALVPFRFTSPTTGKLNPGQTAQLSLQITCPNFRTSQTSTVIVQSFVSWSGNLRLVDTQRISVTAECQDDDARIENTSSVSLVGAIGKSVTGSITIRSVGVGNLVANTTSESSWLTVQTNASIILEANRQAVVNLNAQCPSTATVLNGNLRIGHNGVNVSSPLFVPVTVQCIAVTGFVAYEYLGTDRREWKDYPNGLPPIDMVQIDARFRWIANPTGPGGLAGGQNDIVRVYTGRADQEPAWDSVSFTRGWIGRQMGSSNGTLPGTWVSAAVAYTVFPPSLFGWVTNPTEVLLRP